MRNLLMSLMVVYSFFVVSVVKCFSIEYLIEEKDGISFQSLGLKEGDIKKITSIDWHPIRNQFLVAIGLPKAKKDLFIYKISPSAEIVPIALKKIAPGFTVQAAAWSPLGDYIAVGGKTKNGFPAIRIYGYNAEAQQPLTFIKQTKAWFKGGYFKKVAWFDSGNVLMVSGYNLKFLEGVDDIASEMIAFKVEQSTGDLNLQLYGIQNINQKLASVYDAALRSDIVVQLPKSRSLDLYLWKFTTTDGLKFGNMLTLEGFPPYTAVNAYSTLVLDNVPVGAVLGGVDQADGNQLLCYLFDAEFTEAAGTSSPVSFARFATDAAAGRIDKICTPLGSNLTESVDVNNGMFVVGGKFNTKQLGFKLFKFFPQTQQFNPVSSKKLLSKLESQGPLSSAARISELKISADGAYLLVVGKHSPDTAEISFYRIRPTA